MRNIGEFMENKAGIMCSCKPLDNATYEMCKDHFEEFTAYLEEEAKENSRLQYILKTKAPWEK